MLGAPLYAAGRIALALVIGLLIGFEREWANKNLGLRTFALTAMLGTLAAMVSEAFTIALSAGVLLLIVLANLNELRTSQKVEITTSTALLFTFVLGVLVGHGLNFVPAGAAILATLLLTWKLEMRRFVGEVHPAEIHAAIWLAVLAFVIYPLLPNRAVDPWGLVNPHAVWVAVIVVAAVGFINYVLMRLYSARGLLYSAVLGGAVNSAATMVELGGSLRAAAAGDAAVLGLSVDAALLGTLAMFARNAVLLLLFGPLALRSAGLPLAAMATIAGLLAWRGRAAGTAVTLRLDSPVSFRRVFEFGALFLAVEVAGTLGDRYLGHYGFYAVSIIGGIFNSASTTVAAGQMLHSGTLGAATAGTATVLASMTSAVANTILMNRAAGDPASTRLLRLRMALVVAAGATLLLLARARF